MRHVVQRGACLGRTPGARIAPGGETSGAAAHGARTAPSSANGPRKRGEAAFHCTTRSTCAGGIFRSTAPGRRRLHRHKHSRLRPPRRRRLRRYFPRRGWFRQPAPRRGDRFRVRRCSLPPPSRPQPSKRPRRASPAQVPLPEPAPPARARSPQPSPYGVQPKHLALILIVLVTAVVAALFFSRPSLFHGDSGLALEGVPEEAAGAIGAGSAVFGDLAGRGHPHVVHTQSQAESARGHHQSRRGAAFRNRSPGTPTSGRGARPTRPRWRASRSALDEELGPQQIRDVETDLMALGTLASFPKWDQLRVDLEAR